MNKNYWWWIAGLIIVIVALGAWYWVSMSNTMQQANTTQQTSDTGGTTPTTSSTQPGDGTPVSQNLILGVNQSQTLGTYLTAYNGMTLYTSSKDTAGVSNCTGTCATAWPPYVVNASDSINVPANITGKVATLTRADGTMQITYNGKPVYFWQGDVNPGDTTGQGVNGFTVAKP